MKTTVAEAFEVLRAAWNEESGPGSYVHGWHCNLAMAAVDEGVDRATADRIADRFMRLLQHDARSSE